MDLNGSAPSRANFSPLPISYFNSKIIPSFILLLILMSVFKTVKLNIKGDYFQTFIHSIKKPPLQHLFLYIMTFFRSGGKMLRLFHLSHIFTLSYKLPDLSPVGRVLNIHGGISVSVPHAFQCMNISASAQTHVPRSLMSLIFKTFFIRRT